MNQNYPEYIQEEESIDIKKYIFLVLSHWWWFAISLFIALTIAYLVNRYSEKMYEVSCSVIVGEEEPQAGSVESILDELSKVRNRRRKAVVENEISILKSYKMARIALEELDDFNISYIAVGRRNIAESKMYNKCPFYVVPDTSKTNISGYPVSIFIISKTEYKIEIDEHYNISEVHKFGEPFNHPDFNFTIYQRDKNIDLNPLMRKYFFMFNDINSMSNAYRSALNVTDPSGVRTGLHPCRAASWGTSIPIPISSVRRAGFLPWPAGGTILPARRPCVFPAPSRSRRGRKSSHS